jgi:Rrf2 family protein
MISSTAEYALRAIVHLALNPDRAETAESIARATRVPPGYMSKVMKDLTNEGLVTSRRGPRGGFTLARPTGKISLLDVVNAVDPVQRIRTCPLGLPSHGTRLCALHQRLDDAMAQIETTLAASSIAELVSISHAKPQCSFPTLERAPLPAAPQARARAPRAPAPARPARPRRPGRRRKS